MAFSLSTEPPKSLNIMLSPLAPMVDEGAAVFMKTLEDRCLLPNYLRYFFWHCLRLNVLSLSPKLQIASLPKTVNVAIFSNFYYVA